MNKEQKIIIIGCGAGGGTSAQFAKKQDRKSKITIFEKGKYPQYSKCGLPYVISKTIPAIDDLIEFSEDWFINAGINLYLGTSVEQINPEKRKIIITKGNSKTEESYDSLIIATGSKQFIPPIENINNVKDGVFHVRTIDDVKNILSFIKKGKNVCIIGAGFIGLEMADNFKKIGLNISVIESLPQILLRSLDEDMAKIVYSEISGKTNIFINSKVEEITSNNGKISKVLIKNNESGNKQEIDTDILIIATGVRPESNLAKNTGCKIGVTGGIVVNEKCETSIKHIYAVGDCTEYLDFVTKKPITGGLGSVAVRQAITAGINAAGGDYKMPKGILQTRTTEFFGLEIASVGPTINNLEPEKIISAKFKGSSLPEYFPGGKPITLKVTVDNMSGKILSAQAVGENAAQRINTFATAILGGMTVEEFKKLETAYAPPIAPTLDVVTLVCDIISKKLNLK